ncbi:response regulator [Ktedonospora formicarum]|uniref:Response regulatory domain-containing protein n=1 Tax=Ktedonospora formicarum TaxID=2778364 RepID=A0A8J3I562_9CHLR|nr:response regulator [Ktedonospora formicarum]GHO48876.1 hypothetical protein KSX_70390 [Ktedonospora formicarum]
MAHNQPHCNQAPKLILIIEDNEDFSEILTTILQRETAYYPLLATTGRQATTMMNHLQPDLLLIDYILPDIDGLTLYEHVRAQERIPTILMSAIPHVFLEVPHHEQLVSLEKPFAFQVLMQHIHQLLAA